MSRSGCDQKAQEAGDYIARQAPRPHERQEACVKRTRRVEITRYRSHVASSGGDADAATDAETLALDVLLEAVEATLHTSEEVHEGERAEGDVEPPAPRRSGLLRLPGWLRKG
jgi:hypothetical protein